MYRAVLIFPDTTGLAEFILTEKLSKIEANSIEQSLTGTFTEDQIKKARKEYSAYVKVYKLRGGGIITSLMYLLGIVARCSNDLFQKRSIAYFVL